MARSFLGATNGVPRAVRVPVAACVIGVASIAWLGCTSERARAAAAGETTTIAPTRAPDPGDAAPCDEGETRACHVDLGVHDGIQSCLVGVETCAAGTFGPCEGAFSARPAATVTKSTSTKSLSTATACAGNPCDPGCAVFDEVPSAPIAPTSSRSTTWTGGLVTTLAGGFQNKGLKDADHPPNTACTSVSDCQFDHHCVGGACVPWRPGETDPSCAGVDLTLGPTCSGRVPVCNRGKTTAPAGVELLVFSGNSQQLQSDLGTCGGFHSTLVGSCATSLPIAPGTCIDVTDCPLGGTKAIVVNTGTTSPIPECACGNDWTVYHNGGACSSTTFAAYEPLTHAERYVATCPSGQRPRWRFLSWDADVPTNGSGASRLLVRAHGADSLATLAPTCADCVVVGDAPTLDPAKCSAGGPSPCPKDLGAALGAHASDAVLELVFDLSPTPDANAAPTLRGWEVTFTCVPTE